MTFTELLTILRREVLGDPGSQVWEDDDLQEMLKNASSEIAGLLGFPQAYGNANLSAGASAFTPASDILNTQLGQVMIGDANLHPVTLAEVLQKRAWADPGLPEAYSFDPRRGANSIEFAPVLEGAAMATYEYTRFLDPGDLADGDEAWEGLFPQWHWLVPIRAGANAWRSVQAFDRSDYFRQEFLLGMEAFSGYLGITNPLARMEEPRLRRDHAGVS